MVLTRENGNHASVDTVPGSCVDSPADMTSSEPPSPGAGARTRTPRPSTAQYGAQLMRTSPNQDGWFLAVNLVTATLVWGGIGWLVDRWLGTTPWLMSIGFVVGNACGIYLLWLKTSAPPAPAATTDDRAEDPSG
ncbi:hypothetical protein BH20ACT7_BH20ACT7_09830 [soil metagenome]